jgi:excisionase family DNA binding protein
MKTRPTQFGARENTASSIQHASRPAVQSPLQESLRAIEGPRDLVEARPLAPGDLEVFEVTGADTTNRAAAARREEVAASGRLVAAEAAHGKEDAPSVVGHGAGRSVSQVQSNIEFEPLLDVVEAARLLRIHPKTLRVKASHGIIPAIQIGRVGRFRASALNRWLEGISR